MRSSGQAAGMGGRVARKENERTGGMMWDA